MFAHFREVEHIFSQMAAFQAASQRGDVHTLERVVQALNGAVWPTRAPMMADTISTRTSSLRRRDPVAIRALASPMHHHRPTYPHSLCGLLESRCSPGTWCMWSTSFFFVYEHAEPFYYRPLPRPQPSAPPRTRCANAVDDLVLGPLHACVGIVVVAH